jgi:hypothetical protein
MTIKVKIKIERKHWYLGCRSAGPLLPTGEPNRWLVRPKKNKYHPDLQGEKIVFGTKNCDPLVRIRLLLKVLN